MRSESALQELMEESERLWNAGDQHGWEELWRAAVPGEHVLESPAGSTPKRGFEEARRQVWQQTQPVRITTKHLIISGSSVAALTENVISIGDETFSIPSIDTYDFDDNGNCYERNYFALPAS
jgi:hypothetical protein